MDDALHSGMGVCRLCGTFTKLTFEHIPPRRAFNGHEVALWTLESLARKYESKQKFRRGLGRKSLCGACNEKTGRWYGQAYARWTIQSLDVASRVPLNSRISLPFQIWPLKAVKQIATMALAMSYPESIGMPHFRALRRFVLRPRERYLPSPFRIYTYLFTNGLPRFSSTGAVLDVRTGRSSVVLAEIALPPLGYCVVSEQEGEYSAPTELGLASISHWGSYDFDSLETVWLKIPRLDPCGPCPLDYLSKREEPELE